MNRWPFERARGRIIDRLTVATVQRTQAERDYIECSNHDRLRVLDDVRRAVDDIERELAEYDEALRLFTG